MWRRAGRSRAVRAVAATVAAGVTLGVISSFNGAVAATTTSDQPQAQAVGNFLDATLGGNTLDAVAKLKYASAKAPGSDGTQNPLDVTALNAINLPLTGALQLPQLAGIKLGAVNQVAKAYTNGKSYGAAGAVSNSGGVSVGGNNNAYPANATIDLKASSIAGNSGISVPGGGTADALGEVKATIGAVSALASTPKGYGKAGSTKYQIADVSLSLDSPLLGSLLGNVTGTLTTTLSGIVSSLTGAIGTLGVLPKNCKLTNAAALDAPISLEKGAVTIDPSNAAITVSLEKLLSVLGLNLNKLPANTDLLSYLLAYLTSPDGLAKGLEGVVNGLLDPLETAFNDCTSALKAIPALGQILTGLISTLESGQKTVESTVSTLVGDIAGAAGVNPLAPLADVLEKLIDIGVNVQPNGKSGSYTDPLAATPKQGTPVVKGQTLVRAIEVNVAAGAGSSLPGLGSLPSLGSLTGSAFAGPMAAAPGDTGILTLALANAAAGPSNAPAAAPTTSAPANPTTSAPATGTALPTGVPAGQGTGGGSPTLPLVLVLLTLGLAAGGVVTYRLRASRGMH